MWFLRVIRNLLIRIISFLNEKLAFRDIRFVVGKKKGKNDMTVGQKIPYVINEVDVLNAIVVPAKGDTVTVVSSDTSVVSVAPDDVVAPGSLSSGFLVAGVAGSVTVTASAFNALGVAIGTPKVVTVDVTAVVSNAVDITFVLGEPISQ